MAAYESSEPKGTPHQLVQDRAGSPTDQRLLERTTGLTEQLFLGYDRGVEARNDLEDSSHCFAAAPLRSYRTPVCADGDQLDTVAGLEEDRLRGGNRSHTIGGARALVGCRLSVRHRPHFQVVERNTRRWRQGNTWVRRVAAAPYASAVFGVKPET